MKPRRYPPPPPNRAAGAPPPLLPPKRAAGAPPPKRGPPPPTRPPPPPPLATPGFCAKLAVGASAGRSRVIAAAILKTLALIMIGSIRGTRPSPRADAPAQRQIVGSQLYPA